MALYEFECLSCGKRFEVSRPITEHDQLKEQPPACPDCKKADTKQLVSMFHCKAPARF